MAATWRDIQARMMVVLEVEGCAGFRKPTVGLHQRELVSKVRDSLQRDGLISSESSEFFCVNTRIVKLLKEFNRREGKGESAAIRRMSPTGFTFWLNLNEITATIVLRDDDWPPCGNQL